MIHNDGFDVPEPAVSFHLYEDNYIPAHQMVSAEVEAVSTLVWEFRTEVENMGPCKCAGCDCETDIVFFPNVGDPDGLCAECATSCVDCGDHGVISWVGSKARLCPVCFAARLTSDIYKEG